jgi:hypothetical protein
MALFAERDASLFFHADEIRAAYLLAKQARPASPPPLNRMIRLIASPGGFPGRKSDGDTGAKILRIGLQASLVAKAMEILVPKSSGSGFSVPWMPPRQFRLSEWKMRDLCITRWL